MLTYSIAFADPVSDNKVIGTNNYHFGMNRVLENLVEQYIAQKKYKDAISQLEEEIKKNPTNSKTLYKEAALYADIEEYYKAKRVLTKIKTLEPENKDANKLTQIVEKKIKELPHNEIGFDQDQAYVSDLHAYWTYSSGSYYRLTEMGSFGARINYANRYGTNGVQYQIDTYPKFSDSVYANISFGYANGTQILFPNFQYRIEPYINFPPGIELSLGHGLQRYTTFDHQNLSSYTASFGKYFGNYFIWYRPLYYTTTSTNFNELGFRRYFKDKNSYINIKLNAGRLPDIGDLPPLDQIIVVRQKGGSLSCEYSLTKTLFLKGGIGYTHQIYLPSMLLRETTDGTIGFVYRY